MSIGPSMPLRLEKPERIDLAQAARYFGARGGADAATRALLEKCAVPLLADYPNLLVCGTFSKSRSLAGLRLGFAIGSAELIGVLEAVKNSYNSYTVDNLSLLCGAAAMDDEAYFAKTTAAVITTRERVRRALEQMGFEIEASHHEVAEGQHEIDFKYADALRTADNIMTFKLAVKTLAQKNGLHATFMPKPIFGINGSGMHTNMSLFQGGKNAFYDPDDPKGLSKEAYSFIAGLLAHVKGMAAVTNPLVNSYKRLVPGYEAPCYLAWSASNRSALIRIPAARGQSTRVELRSPDPACNPYLELALCLAAGLDGIEKGLTPPPEVTENIFDMNAAARKAHGIDSLPDSLEEAIHALEADPLVLDTLGEHVAANYIEGKRKEWEEYCTRVSSWEREKYIINY